MNVAISGSFLNGSGMVVHMQRGLFHVALGSHVMPAVVVQSGGRLNLHLEGTVSHVEREDDLMRRWKGKQI